MSVNRAKGRKWEADTRDWFIQNNLPAIRYDSVSDKRGDVDVSGVPVVVECKDWKTLRFDWWVHQAQRSSEAKGVAGKWVIVAKRYGKATPQGAYIMVSPAFLLEAMELMKERYAEDKGV